MSIVTKRIMSALFLITILLPFGPALVQADERAAKLCEPGAFDRSDHFLRHVLAYQGELRLTQEQTGKLGEIHQALKKNQGISEADFRTIQGHLFPLLHDDKADLTAIEATFKQMESLKTGAHMTAVKATREAQTLLTPEQRGKLQTLLMQERQRSGQRREGDLPASKERS
jgi:Spy/CpxP family protein refolding chaperone